LEGRNQENHGLRPAKAKKKSKQYLISTKKLSMVVHNCHPCYVGSISRRIIVKDSSSKNAKTLSQK
jgi:hypothetical protein